MKTDLTFPPFAAREGLVVGLVLCLVLATACEHRDRSGDEGVPPDSLQRKGPSQVTQDARFVMNEAGRRRAIIRAEEMQQYQTDDSTYSVWRTHGDSARVHSYVFEEGDSSATITADSVAFFNQEGRFEAYGDVVVVTQENRRLVSEHLTWLQADRKIRTRRFVHITTPSEDVPACAMHSLRAAGTCALWIPGAALRRCVAGADTAHPDLLGSRKAPRIWCVFKNRERVASHSC